MNAGPIFAVRANRGTCHIRTLPFGGVLRGSKIVLVVRIYAEYKIFRCFLVSEGSGS